MSLGRNNIKKIEGLDAVAETLEELWLSYNLIEKLNGVEVCKKLKILYLSNNKIKAWDGVTPAVSLTEKFPVYTSLVNKTKQKNSKIYRL